MILFYKSFFLYIYRTKILVISLNKRLKLSTTFFVVVDVVGIRLIIVLKVCKPSLEKGKKIQTLI
jgi:hypothetical protein